MMDFMLLSLLVMGHIVGDFYWQPRHWVDARNKHHFRSKELYFHVTIHAFISLFILYFFTSLALPTLCLFTAIICGSHLIFDLGKSYLPQTFLWFVLDQISHLLVLAAIWGYITQGNDLFSFCKSLIQSLNYKHIVVLCAYLLVLRPASILIGMVLKPWTEAVKSDDADSGNADSETLKLAGHRIGCLERLLILTFILLNQFSAIGFLLAAKSVFRFGELQSTKDKKLTEYVMLGSFTSFVVTIFIGLIAVAIVGKITLFK